MLVSIPRFSDFDDALTCDAPPACSGCRYLSCLPRSANDYCKGYVSFCFRLFAYLYVVKSIALESPLLVVLRHRICTANPANVKLDSDFNAPRTTHVSDFFVVFYYASSIAI